MSTLSDMNMGGKGGKSTRIIVDLNDAVKQLNISLEKTKKLSAEILTNMKGIKGGGGGSNPMSPDTFSTTPVTAATGATGSTAMATFMQQGTVAVGERSPSGFVQQAPRSGGGGGGGGGGNSGPSLGSTFAGVAKTLVGTVAMATLQAIQPEQYIENDMSARRAGFYMGYGGFQGFTKGGQLFQSMMNGGTATDPLDAARAVMMGASNGMAPGAPGYSNVSAGAQMFSNLMPGAGLQGGMQATVALNQAQSVNKLRMIGIQVRGSNGTMNSPQQIADQVWAYLNKIKTGGKGISKADIEFSLQPGNSLDGMLNQYFGNDPVLRQGVVTYLLQKADGTSSGGGAVTKSSLVASGASTAVAQSFSNMYSAQYGAVNAYTPSGVAGIIGANQDLTNIANYFKSSVSNFGSIVESMTYLKTFSAGFNNSIGTLLSGLASVLSPILSALVAGKVAGKVGSPGGGTAGGGEPAGSPAGAPGAPGEPGWGAAAVPVAAMATATVSTWSANMVNLYNTDKKAYAKEVTSQINAVKANSSNGLYSATDFMFGGQAPTSRTSGFSQYMGQTGNNGMGSSAGPGTPVGVGGDVGSGVFDPIKGQLIINKNGEFHNQAPFRGKGWHRGVDFRAPDNTSVFAVKSGKVIKAGTEGDLGTMIRIDHGDGTRTVYGHLSSLGVSEGQTVNASDPIGLSGHSGGVVPAGPQGAHLHLALEDTKGNVYDPMTLFNGGAGVPTGTASSAPSANHQLFQTHGASLFGAGQAAFSNVSSLPAGGGAGNSSVVASSSGASYGNVTVHINLPTGSVVNEQKLAREVKRILDEQDQIKMAVAR